MRIVFKQDYLSKLYFDQTGDKKQSFQPDVIKKYTKEKYPEECQSGGRFVSVHIGVDKSLSIAIWLTRNSPRLIPGK